MSPPANNLTGQNLGGLTLTPGVYHFNSSAQLTGILDLNTLGNPDAVFHFQIGSTLTTASFDGGILEAQGGGIVSNKAITINVATYSGGTTIDAGTLQIGNGPAAGSIAGDITDNAILAFDRGGLVTFGGVISGPGEFLQAGTGAVILTGNNVYTGSTTVSAGTLAAGSPGGFSPTSAFIVNSILDLNGFAEAIRSRSLLVRSLSPSFQCQWAWVCS